MNHKLIGAAFAVAVAGSASAEIIIDDFSTGGFAASITSGDTVLQQSGTMIGGQRDVGLEVLSNPFNQFFDVNLEEGGLGLAFSSGIGLAGQLGLDYDGNTDVETGSLPFQLGEGLNLDFSGLTSIDFGFTAADLSFEILVTLQTIEGGVPTATSAASIMVGGSQSPFTSSLMLSEFDIDLSNINRVGILFNFNDGGDPTGSLDFILDGITVVPAPGALALLGLAGLAGTRRRRG
jgi:MYXO-CTERM domain-containing protein